MKKRIPRIALAACLAAAALAGAAVLRGAQTDPAVLADGSEMVFVKTSTAPGSAASQDLDVWVRPLMEEESAACFPTLPFTGQALFSAEPDQNGGRQLLGLEGHTGDVKLVISMTDQSMRDTFVGGLQRNTEVLGIPVTVGYAETNFRGGGGIYYAEYAWGDGTVYVENFGTAGERERVKSELAATVQALIGGGFQEVPLSP